jgi:hypothetical protein
MGVLRLRSLDSRVSVRVRQGHLTAASGSLGRVLALGPRRGVVNHELQGVGYRISFLLCPRGVVFVVR